MKAFNKILPIALSAVILLTALLGCNGTASRDPNTPGSQASTDISTPVALSNLAEIQARGVLIVGTAVTEPFVFHDPETDALIGFDVDLAAHIAEALGVTLQFVEMPFANLIPALQDKKVDMTIAAMYITADREKLVDFSQPYLKTGLVMVANPEQEVQIKTVEDLAGLRVGVKIGATGENMARELVAQGINLEIVEFKNTLDSFLDLEVGRVDVIFNDYLNTLAYIKDTGSRVQIVTNPAGDAIFLSKAGLGIALQQNSPELLELINSHLDVMEQDGSLKTLYEFWLLPASTN